MEEFNDKTRELIEKYNIDIDKLEEEQSKLSKNLELKDKIDFKLATRIAGMDNVFIGNKIISVVIVIQNGEIVEQEYFQDKIRFPFIHGFRAYRELPTMVRAFNLLDEKPDLVFVRGHGILHSKGLGLASHFALSVGVPVIGVADTLLVGEVDEDEIVLRDKVVGKVVHTKEGARPLYVSPGNLISVKTAIEMMRQSVVEPHKVPEPLRLAKKYAKEVRKEIFGQ